MDASRRESGSSTDSSSDEDTAGPELSDQDMKRMLALEEALAADPKSYDNHVQYITVLRRANLKERLKAARRAMHTQFPMTEELWMDWLSDESRDAEVPHMAHLYDLAVEDYLSISVWRSYLEYMRKAQSSAKITEADFRQLYERTLNIAGLHVTLGSQLWNFSREWELAQLAADPADEQQRGRVRALFHRQLQVPLVDGSDTLEKYQTWESSLGSVSKSALPASVKQNASRALSAAKLRAASEAAVAEGKVPDHDLLAAFTAYLKLEETGGDAARLQLIYERALVAFPVTSHLWLQYARFAETKLNISAIIDSIFERAARNCPWVGAIWARRLNALERGGAPDNKHAAVYASAIAAGLQTSEDLYEVVLARLDAVRRRQPFDATALRTAFTQASATLQASLGDALDPALRVTAYWAACEANLAHDIEAARSVWEAILRTSAGRSSEPWLAFIAMERSLRNLDKVRALYRRCYARQFADGSQVAFCQAWLRFEREEGSVEDHLQASLKVDPILNQAAAVAAARTDAANAAASTAAMGRAPLLSPQEMRQLRQQKDPNFGQAKAKKDRAKQAGQKRQQDAAQEADASVQPNKRSRADRAAAAPEATLAKASPDGHQQGAVPSAGAVQAEPMQTDDGPASPQSTQPPEASTGAVAAADSLPRRAPVPRDDSTTVFVKNMNFKVTDKELWDFFTSCGTVTKVAVKRNEQGHSKGFAFVHFSSQDAVPVAISKSGTPLRGRPLVIEASQPLQPRRGGGRGRGGKEGGGRGAGIRDGGGRTPGGRGGHGRDGGRGRGRGDFSGADAEAVTAVEGLGGGAGRGGWASSGSGKQKLDLDQPTKKAGLGFMPRSVAVKPAGDAAPAHPALQNQDFRAMLLAKKPAEDAPKGPSQ